MDPQTWDIGFQWVTYACAAMIFIIMLGIVLELSRNSYASFQKFGFSFFIAYIWNPVTQEFGALSSIFGTLVSTAIAMLLATPVSLMIAIFLVELAPPTVGLVVSRAIELLAAIPSIIYGMWGLFVFAPYLADHIQPALGEYLGFLPLFQGPPMGIGMLSAGIILALMVLPFICAVSRDVLAMVPAVLKESAYGMGSTTWEVVWKVSLPYGMRGIVGAMILGLGRAIGETMAVTFVIGNDHTISASLYAPGNTIASTLANEFVEAVEPVYRASLVQLALVLFLITVMIQWFAYQWLSRRQRKMEGMV